MDDQQHRRIAAGLRGGNPEAWGDLYSLFAERVYRVAARLVDDHEIADVVQETMIAAARTARGFDPERGSLWAWLWGICRNQAALRIRQKQQQCRLVSANGVKRRPQVVDPTVDALESAETVSLVRATLTEIPEDQGFVLIAFYLDGVSVEQMARNERCSESAMRSRLARARTAFRIAFARYHEPLAEPSH